MLKSIFISLMLLVGSGFGCTIFYTTVRYDTLSPEIVAVTAASNGPSGRDTLLISRKPEMKSYFQSLFADSSLVFIGAIDSLIQQVPGKDTVIPGLVPAIVFAPDDTMPQSRTTLYFRLRIDTLIRGTLPSKSFWVKAGYVQSLCGFGYGGYNNRVFLNASASFSKLSDLKVSTQLDKFAGMLPSPATAHYFDGRYLVARNFPGLKLDITEVLPTYPATGILRRGVPWRPANVSGKTYQPDGRRVQGVNTPRKTPLPLLK
jgi:hypothetical protein